MVDFVDKLRKSGFYHSEIIADDSVKIGDLSKCILRYIAIKTNDSKSAFDYARLIKIISKSESDYLREINLLEISDVVFNAFDFANGRPDIRNELVWKFAKTTDIKSKTTYGDAAALIYNLLIYLKQEIFKNPTNKYRIHPMEHEMVEDNKNIKPFLIETGAGGAVINSSWKNGWNQNIDNLDMLKETAEIMKNEGLHSWLYDDVYYPSGWADGYIEKKNPDFIEKNIGCIFRNGEGAIELKIELPANGHYFICANFYHVDDAGSSDYENPIPVNFSRKEVVTSTPDGKWDFAAFFIRDCNIWPYSWATEISPPIGPRKHLSHLDAPAVDAFIEGALGTVESRLGDLSEYFDAVFTDESGLNFMYLHGKKGKPNYESVPFGNTLFEDFESTYGYDLKTVLPYLFLGDSVKAKTIRIHYYTIVSNLMSENFTGRISKWCEARGVSFSGHIHSEEGLHLHVGNYGNFMQAVMEMSYPGFDMLCSLNKFFWTKGEGISSNSHFMSGKYTSSATRIKGINTTMVEICPVSHQQEFFKDIFNEFISFTTSTIFTGATHINLYGYRFISDNNDFNKFNEYTGRLCYFARNATSAVRIGVYYPVISMQANIYAADKNMDNLSKESKIINNYMENLAYFLYNNKLDFSYLTDDAIENSEICGCELQVMLQNYRVILIPPGEVMALSVYKKLINFEKAGGEVIFLEKLPTMGINFDEHETVKSLSLNRRPNILNLSNLAIGAKVHSDYVTEGYDVQAVTDGSPDCEFSWDGFSSDVLPAKVYLKLPGIIEFNRIDLYSKMDYEQTQYKAYYKKGDEWILFSEKEDNTYFHMYDEFQTVTSDEVMLLFNKGCKTQPEIARLNEVQLYKVRNSDSNDEFANKLHEIIGTTISIDGDKSNSIKIANYIYDGRKLFFVINSDSVKQKISISDKYARLFKVYNPLDGSAKEYEDIIEIEIEAGRGIFVELES